MPKEAVVVVVDCHPSMGQMFDGERTRLDVAKELAVDIVADLMIQSKTNEATVVALPTVKTKNFLCADVDYDGSDENMDGSDQEEDTASDRPFKHLTEFSGNGEVMGMRQPLPDLLGKIKDLEVADCKADIISGLNYAADALYQKTATKKYVRRIVLLTDAEHKLKMDVRLTAALEQLRAMETRLEVVGMGFETSQEFDKAAVKKVKVEDGGDENDNEAQADDNQNGSGSETEDAESDDASDDGEEEIDIIHDIKRPNEKFLVSLAHKTGGFVFAAKDLQAVFDKILGRRVIVPSKRKLIFEIAPGHVLEDARYYLLLSKAASTRLKKKLVMIDHATGEPRKNALGDEMCEDLENIYQYIDPETGEDVDEEQISKAYKFGSDLIPFNAIDEAGLEIQSPVKLSIVGYANAQEVPQYLQIGPPYVLTGNESRRCCAAISALARALQRTNKVAIATFVKTKNHAPILCGLFPLVEEESDEPLRLIIMRLPFADDVKLFMQLPCLDSVVAEENPKATTACDNLIDSLMLPEDALEYATVPNPKIRSFYKTVIGRVLDQEAPVVGFRTSKIMETPEDIADKAQPAVDAYYNVFDLKKEDQK